MLETLVRFSKEFEEIQAADELREIEESFQALRSVMIDWVALYNTSDPDVENWIKVFVIGTSEEAAVARLAEFGNPTPDFLIKYQEWEFGWND